MSSTFNDDPAVQARLAALDRRLEAQQEADLRTILGTPSGRRLYYRIVFELCRLEALAFEPQIKDGLCAALHHARNEGARWVGSTLAREAQAYAPESWTAMLIERIQTEVDRADKRKRAMQAREEVS